jgi:hypothetical protein
MSDDDKAAAKKAADDAKKEAKKVADAEAKAKKEAMQLAYFHEQQLAAHKKEMNSVDGGGKAKKMRRSRRKSLRKTRQRNKKDMDEKVGADYKQITTNNQLNIN